MDESREGGIKSQQRITTMDDQQHKIQPQPFVKKSLDKCKKLAAAGSRELREHFLGSGG